MGEKSFDRIYVSLLKTVPRWLSYLTLIRLKISGIIWDGIFRSIKFSTIRKTHTAKILLSKNGDPNIKFWITVHYFIAMVKIVICWTPNKTVLIVTTSENSDKCTFLFNCQKKVFTGPILVLTHCIFIRLLSIYFAFSISIYETTFCMKIHKILSPPPLLATVGNTYLYTSKTSLLPFFHLPRKYNITKI